MLKDIVKDFLIKYDLLKPENNILVALSGGYDSLCLLYLLKELKNEYQFNLTAIHLNHGWRGDESDKDEINCKNFSKDINFYSEKLPNNVAHTETAAREARYKFFERCAKKFNSKIILTAHNANDNAETIFYRLLKGTGIKGLEGIQENRGIYYRPLLKVYRKDIENYCKINNLTPNTDSSNSDTKFARNKIRLDIFPKLLSVSPDFIKKLNALSDSAKSFDKILESQIKNLEEYTTKAFCDMTNIYQTTVVHSFFREHNLDYDKKTIEKIVIFINNNSTSKSGKKISLTNGLWLFVNSQKIEAITDNISLSNKELQITQEGNYKFRNDIFSITKINDMPDKLPKDNEFRACVAIKSLNLTLRHRKDGDIIQPLGMSGTQKLKKYLNAKKIPNHEKDLLLLLCDKNEILWVAGVGISDKIKVTDKPTHIIELKRG